MKLLPTKIPEVVIIEPTVFEDSRGWFLESFNEKIFHQELKKLNLPPTGSFVQDNISSSRKNVVRGLHYQLPPYAQGKLVRVVSGKAFDVAVDIRPWSSTYGQCIGVELSADNKRSLWVPAGFAHGFVALEDETIFFYKTTNFYHQESEAAIIWNDSDLAIEWPVKNPIINEKDNIAPSFQDSKKFQPDYLGSVESVDFKVIGDERGSLVALENHYNLPFKLERAYYIFDTQKEVARGFHAHRVLQQMAVCVSGSCRMVLDDGMNRRNILLDDPKKGVLIKNLIWREMYDFSDDCVLLVLASEIYNENDYIRDYEQFKEIVCE